MRCNVRRFLQPKLENAKRAAGLYCGAPDGGVAGLRYPQRINRDRRPEVPILTGLRAVRASVSLQRGSVRMLAAPDRAFERAQGPSL